MKYQPRFPEDLSIWARRGPSSQEQLRELRRALEQSALLRTADTLGRAFDASSEVEEGDEQRIARWVDAALGHRQHRARPARFGLRLGLLAAIVFVSASAAGWIGWQATRGRPTTTLASAIPSAPDVPKPASPAAMRQTARESLGTTAPPAASASTAMRDAKPRSPAPPAPPPESAAQLFSEANTARRLGRTHEAVSRYLRLQQAFDGAPEATMSYVSLGRLYLARGEARAALGQFSHYLEGGGPLEEEALLGRARALSRLGRPTLARAAWQRLLSRFPRSVYASEAKERVSDTNANARD